MRIFRVVASLALVLRVSTSRRLAPVPGTAARGARPPRALAVCGGAAAEGTVRQRVYEQLPPLIFASLFVASVTYPVDFMRAVRMASAADANLATLSAREAAKLFTAGLLPEVAKGTLSRVIKFGGYPVAYAALNGGGRSADGTARARAAAGALCTVPEIALITPLEVAKLALQLDAVGGRRFGNSLGFATRELVQAGGVKALYAGHCMLQCRQAVWTAVFFATQPMFADAIRGAGGDAAEARPALVNAASGLGAGILGALLNNPIDVVRSVSQKAALQAWVFSPGGAAAPKAALPYIGPSLGALRSVVGARGVRGLWAGAGFKALHLGAGGALMAAMQPACATAWASMRRRAEARTRGAAPRRARAPLQVVRGGALRGGATPAALVAPVLCWWTLLAGWHPLGLRATALGADFLNFDGSRESDLGRVVSTLKVRKRRTTLKTEWLEILRFSKSAQSARIYHALDDLVAAAMKMGLVA
ncbi:mitochondrial carrier domain-containing protein [Pelagophyceae sp. CCMP2097]|nr:mitochondrial carrier domain-containing protein [Pelagophyceae sp. CCMP2097]